MTDVVHLTEAEIAKMREASEWLRTHPGAVDVQLCAVERILTARLAARDAEWRVKIKALADEWQAQYEASDYSEHMSLAGTVAVLRRLLRDMEADS
ncbi:MAG: hypothetical protein QM714_02785 [Nocardioides sp.]|uniref:hypothetical protein n=1 Tax=Nocardioides sp. TaxID=35761 RepID=UPI0039E61BC7